MDTELFSMGTQIERKTIPRSLRENQRGRFLRISILSFAFLAGCASPPEWRVPSVDSRSVESAILWEAQLDDRWTPVEMAALVRNTERFQQQGNFYQVKGDLVVFGHPATYVGMLGVDLFAGPNAVLTGSPQSIAAYIAEHHHARFARHGGTFVCDYKKDIKLVIEKHPNIRGSCILIGAYTGP